MNLRAIQDGIPNAYIRNALDNDDIESLIGGYVRYAVTDSQYEIRAATRSEVDAHYDSSGPPNRRRRSETSPSPRSPR